jgi:hypothetical protein
MSKICIFNTQVAEDSRGVPYISQIPIAPDPPFSTKAVRVLGAEQCAIEWIFTGAFSGASFELRWWLEFWHDNIAERMDAVPPSEREITGIDPDVPWSREVTDKKEDATSISGTVTPGVAPPAVADLSIGGGGTTVTGTIESPPAAPSDVDLSLEGGNSNIILCEPAERKTTFVIPDGKPGVAVWARVKVFSGWMRVGLYAPGQVVPGPGDIGGVGPYNLMGRVHIGGHAEDDYLDAPENNNKPYHYNAGGGSIL